MIFLYQIKYIARAHLYGGALNSFQTEYSYIVGIEPGISRTGVRKLTTELRQLFYIFLS